MENIKIGFIGAGGNMAGAIINGIIKKGYIKPSQIYMYDVFPEKLIPLTKYGAKICKSNFDIAVESDFIFLCVKPQNIFELLQEIGSAITPEKCLVSIIAGISTKDIKNAVGTDCKVIRVMPNTPLLLREGATALVHKEPVSKEEFTFVCDIFSSCGLIEVCDEEQINTVTAVSGSGPAYVFKFAKAVTQEAENQGLDKQVAKNLFIQTLIGSAVMLRDSGFTPEELIKMVTSPNGTTFAALQSFDGNNFDQTVMAAVAACKKRADELGKRE